MTLNTEKKLSQLESELKTLKSTYMVASGLVKVYYSYSPRYQIIDVFEESPLMVEFTSSFPKNDIIIISSIFIEQTTTSGNSINLSQYAIVHPQTGNGKILIEIPLLWLVDSVRIGVASTVPGFFTRVS